MKKIVGLFMLIAASLLAAQSFAQSKPAAVINHVAINVVDVQKSGDFYINIIGLDTIPEPFHDGAHIWLRIGPNAAMHIIGGAPVHKEYYKNSHTCFSVGSVDAFIEKLKKKSIPFEDVAGKKNVFSLRVDGVKQLWLQDPDGYWIEINDAKY